MVDNLSTRKLKSIGKIEKVLINAEIKVGMPKHIKISNLILPSKSFGRKTWDLKQKKARA